MPLSNRSKTDSEASYSCDDDDDYNKNSIDNAIIGDKYSDRFVTNKFNSSIEDKENLKKHTLLSTSSSEEDLANKMPPAITNPKPPGRQTNNSLSSLTGNIFIPPLTGNGGGSSSNSNIGASVSSSSSGTSPVSCTASKTMTNDSKSKEKDTGVGENAAAASKKKKGKSSEV